MSDGVVAEYKREGRARSVGIYYLLWGPASVTIRGMTLHQDHLPAALAAALFTAYGLLIFVGVSLVAPIRIVLTREQLTIVNVLRRRSYPIGEVVAVRLTTRGVEFDLRDGRKARCGVFFRLPQWFPGVPESDAKVTPPVILEIEDRVRTLARGDLIDDGEVSTWPPGTIRIDMSKFST